MYYDLWNWGPSHGIGVEFMKRFLSEWVIISCVVYEFLIEGITCFRRETRRAKHVWAKWSPHIYFTKRSSLNWRWISKRRLKLCNSVLHSGMIKNLCVPSETKYFYLLFFADWSVGKLILKCLISTDHFRSFL